MYFTMRVQLVEFYLFIIFMCYLCIPANAQVTRNKYIVERINTENGLPSNGIRGIELDKKKEFLWIATETGLVRYNGKELEIFTDSITFPNKYRGRVRSVGLSNSGRILVLTDDSKVIAIHENKLDLNFKNIASTSTEGFFYIKNGLSLPIHPFKSPTNIQEWEEFSVLGKKYLRLYRNLYQLEKDSLKKVFKALANKQWPFTIQNKLYYIDTALTCFEWLGDSTLRFINQLKPFYFNAKESKKFKLLHDYNNGKSYLIVGTELYELLLNNGQVSLSLITADIPKNEHVLYLRFDNNTAIYYLGTENKGIIVLRPKYFNLVQSKNYEFTLERSFYAQLALPHGQVYLNSGDIVATNKMIYSGNKFIKRAAFPNLFLSADSVVYYANIDEIHAYSLKANVEKSTNSNPIKSPIVFVEKDKYIYCIGTNFIGHIDQQGQLVTDIHFKFNELYYYIYDAKYIGNNNLLIATGKGLFQYNFDSKKIKKVYTPSIPNVAIRSIIPYNGYYFLGSNGAGTLIYNRGIVKELPVDPMGYLKYSHCIVPLKDGTVWISTNSGLFRTSANQLIKAFYQSDFQPIYEYFGKKEGIEEIELNGGCVPCAIKMQNGAISFPSIDGLLQFDPSLIPTNKKEINIYIDHIYCNDSVSVLNTFQEKALSSSTRNVTMKFAIGGMLGQNTTLIEFNIDQLGIWKPLDLTNPKIEIIKPGYGLHSIKFRWKNPLTEKMVIKEWTYSIDTPWYKTVLFYTMVVVIIIAVLSLIIHLRTLQQEKATIKLEKEVAIKTEELQALNKELKKSEQVKVRTIAILNHDLLVPLRYMSIAAGKTEKIVSNELAKKSIKEIASTAKSLELFTSNILNWVKFAELKKVPTSVRFKLKPLIQQELDFVYSIFNKPQNIHIINLVDDDFEVYTQPDFLSVLLYNLILNAFRATISGEIKVAAFKDPTLIDTYVIEVIDTGKGMTNEMLRHILKETENNLVEEMQPLDMPKSNGVGYFIIHDIVNLLKGKIWIKSEQGKGTCVTVQLNHIIVE